MPVTNDVSRAVRLERALKLATLVMLLGWPLAHFILHKSIHNDPWRLAGWAMYTIPKPDFWVSVVTNDDARSSISVCELELEHYVQSRSAFGTLAEPAPLIGCLKARAGVALGSSLRIRQRVFDARNARYEVRVETLPM
jgi:hypothetical protein